MNPAIETYQVWVCTMSMRSSITIWARFRLNVSSAVLNFSCVPSVIADPHQLEQVYLNIINNAADSMLEGARGGLLRIRVFRDNGHVESLREGGPVLGALADAPFTNGRTRLRPGETLLGYSDGIAECRNEKGAEFGAEGLAAAAQVCRGCSASSTLFSVLGAADDFAGVKSREDDMALIVVCRKSDRF